MLNALRYIRREPHAASVFMIANMREKSLGYSAVGRFLDNGWIYKTGQKGCC